MIAEIVGLPGYEAQVSKLLNEDERMAMEYHIACTAEDHPDVTGGGGFRKARWARPGKSGGFRVVYYFLVEPGRVYMAAIYAKSRMGTLSTADRNVLARLAARIKAAAKGDR